MIGSSYTFPTSLVQKLDDVRDTLASSILPPRRAAPPRGAPKFWGLEPVY